MCTGLELLVPALVSAAGTGLSAFAADRARKKQDREAAAGIMRQAEFQKQAGERVNENIQKLRGSNPEGETRAAEGDFMAALKAQQKPGMPMDALQPFAGGSQRYAEDVSTAKQAGETDVAALVKNLAAIDAPTFQRLREGQTTADTASKLGLIDQASQGQDFLTKLRTSSITANPWLTALGTGMQAYGSAKAGAAGKPKPVKAGLTDVQNAELANYANTGRF